MSYNTLINKIFFKKYQVNQIIGKGSFGCIFKGTNIIDKSDIAIKVEKKSSKVHLLETESNYLSNLKGYGIPEIKSYGYSRNFYILIEELLGINLSQLKNKINFKIKDIAMMAIQIIDRIEFVHSKYIIHRDIKPENFTIGYKNVGIIYIIDFGISRKYKSSRTGKHLKFSLTGKMFGTVKYLSYNASRGVEQSRRDDLESIGYMLISLANGKLPWQGIKLKEGNINKKYLEMLMLKKFTPLEKICAGLPIEFVEYLKYCKLLNFEQDPNYDYLRNLFLNILTKNNLINDMKFSWIINKQSINNNDINLNKEKYINKLKRRQSPQIRLYRAIQNSLEKREKNLQPNSEISCNKKNSFPYKKINIDIYHRGASEDCKRNDNSNISKETISDNSHLDQYDIDVSKFQDEKQIYQLYQNRNKNINNSPEKINIFNLKQKHSDCKLTDINKKDNIKDNFNLMKNEKNSQIIVNKINKNEITNKKREINKKNEKDNLNTLNLNKSSLNEDKKDKTNEIHIYNIEKTRKNNKNFSRNLINKLNFGEGSFSFKYSYINNADIINQENEIEKKINENMNNNNNNFSNKNNIFNNNINKDKNENKTVQKINIDNAIKKSRINTENINFKIESFLENKKKENNKGINIKFNNNLNNNLKKQSNNSINQKKNHKPNIKIGNNQNIKKEENSIDKINKEPKKINEKQNNEKIQIIDSKSFELKHYHSTNNNKIYENRYKNFSSCNLIKEKNASNIGNRVKVRLLQYRPLFIKNQQNNISNNIPHNKSCNVSPNNNLRKIIRFNNKETFIQKENYSLLGKMETIQLNNTNQNLSQIKVQQNENFKSQIFSPHDRRKIITNYQLNNNNINNFYQIKNFSNGIKLNNLNQQYLLNNNGKILLKQKRKKFRNFSPNVIKNKNNRVNGFNLRRFNIRGPCRSTSNTLKKKALNYNNNYFKDFNSMK